MKVTTHTHTHTHLQQHHSEQRRVTAPDTSVSHDSGKGWVVQRRTWRYSPAHSALERMRGEFHPRQNSPLCPLNRRLGGPVWTIPRRGTYVLLSGIQSTLPQRLSCPLSSEQRTVYFLVEWVKTYQKSGVIQRPATDPVTRVRFPAKRLYSSSHFYWYLTAPNLSSTCAISRIAPLVQGRT